MWVFVVLSVDQGRVIVWVVVLLSEDQGRVIVWVVVLLSLNIVEPLLWTFLMFSSVYRRLHVTYHNTLLGGAFHSIGLSISFFEIILVEPTSNEHSVTEHNYIPTLMDVDDNEDDNEDKTQSWAL